MQINLLLLLLYFEAICIECLKMTCLRARPLNNPISPCRRLSYQGYKIFSKRHHMLIQLAQSLKRPMGT